MESRGIYQIRNLVNDHIYVGSAVNLQKRWLNHKSTLNNNRHHNLYLQRAWNKYGADSFEFSVLEAVEDKSLLIKTEQKYIDFMMPEYNICSIAGSNLGFKFTEESKQKMSLAQKGKIISEEHKKKLSVMFKGENNPNYGKSHSEEAKLKISVANKGKYTGENAFKAKLTWDLVKEIRAKFVPRKYTYKMLAKEYNVDCSTIERIVNNRAWRI